MEHNTHSEVSVHHEPVASTKRIWRVFWILLALTIIELGLGLSMYAFENMPSWIHMAIRGIICILTLLKAFLIVSYFMHLGDEIRNMVMTVVVPLMLFIWFITAFLWDGNAFRNLRNRYNDQKTTEQLTRPLTEGDTSVHPLH